MPQPNSRTGNINTSYLVYINCHLLGVICNMHFILVASPSSYIYCNLSGIIYTGLIWLLSMCLFLSMLHSLYTGQ